MNIEEAKNKLRETQDSYLKDELDLAIETVLTELDKYKQGIINKISELKRNENYGCSTAEYRDIDVVEMFGDILDKDNYEVYVSELEKKDNIIDEIESYCNEMIDFRDAMEQDYSDCNYILKIINKLEENKDE